MLQSSFIISPKVIQTIQKLPEAERTAISSALAEDIFLGKDPKSYLSPYLSLIYTFIRDYVDRDTRRSCVQT